MKKIKKTDENLRRSKNFKKINELNEEFQNKMNETREKIKKVRVEFEGKKRKKLLQKIHDSIISS